MPSAGTWDGGATHRRSSSRADRSMAHTGSPRLKRRYPAEAGADDWGKLPEEQDELVRQLKRSLQLRHAFDGEKHSFAMLLRFLRAREYDVDRATSMFLDMLQWRQENCVDHILEEFSFAEREEFLSIVPQGYHKTDKEGHPVYIHHVGRIDLKRIQEVTTEERMLKYRQQEWERCFKYIFPICSMIHNRQIDSTFAIIDVKGVGLYHLTKDVRRIMAKLTKTDSDNYPETLYHTCIINAPSAFRAMWSVIKPMLNKRTQDKIEVCPKDYMSVLRNWIDEESIPEYLGGKSKGTLIDDVGPWRDEELVRQVEMELHKQPDLGGDLLTRPSREDWLSSRRARSLSNASVYEDALAFQGWGDPNVLADEALDDGSSITFSGVDPPAHSTGVSGDGTPVKANSLADRIRELESRVPEMMAHLKMRLQQDEIDHLSGLSSAPRGSLINRVELLEEGMELLLMAQERLWRGPTTMVGGRTSGSTGNNKCCSIM